MYPNSFGNVAGARPTWHASPPAGAAATGISKNNSVGTAWAPIVAPGVFADGFILQNTHPTQILYVSFNAPATVADIALQPGESIEFRRPIANALNAVGSGAGTTFAIIGF